MEQKIIALFDLHIPFHIRLEPVFEFIEDFKPDVVVLGGDVHDWTPVSMWIADQSRHLDGRTVMDCYGEIEDVLLKPLRKCARKAKKVLLEGNHEEWLKKAIEINPNGRGFWELQNNLKGDDIEILPYNVPYRICNHLVYVHGCFTNIYHARKTVESFLVSVLYGHTHDIQTYTHVSPVDVHQYYKGQSCGCLCTLNPNYLKNKPNRWVNGFNFCYVDKRTGYFNDTQVYIVENSFYALGRRYK